MINQFFRTRSWISKVTGGVTILAMFVGFVPMLLLPTPAFAATIPITNGSFGSGSDQNDIASWEEKGSESDSSTLAKNPTSGDDSASPDGGRFAKIGRYQPNPGQDHNGFICQQINAVGYNSLVLKYFWRGDVDAEDNSDLGRVEYLLNGSCESADNQWTSITTHELDNGNTGVTSWSSLQSLNLPSALDNKTFFLRFRAITNASDEYFRVDGVSLEGSPIDVCQNIQGIQAQPPQGYIVKNINDQSQCVPEYVDVTLCKTDDAQVPVGLSGWTLTLDGQGNNDHQGVTGQDGCYTFDNIPYGNYTAGEVLQANWSQVSLPNENGAIQAYQEQNGPYYIRNHYTPPTPTTATLNAQKIICDSEDDLPNWGTGPNVTATTAADFLAEDLAKDQKQDCRLAAWEFQWSLDGVGNPGDNNTATTITNWNNFTSIASVPAGRIWAREVFKDGYIPFTGQNTDQPVSAEFYCASDVLHYDNWEFIDTVAGQTYYCVAFNVPIEDEEPLECNPEVNLLKNGGFEVPALGGGSWDIVEDINLDPSSVLEWLVAWANPQETGRLGLEIQNNVAGTSFEGSQHAELDGDHPVKIWQEVSTVPGREYKLSFSYSPRPGRDAADNTLQVKADGVTLGADLVADGTANSNTLWQSVVRTFTADSDGLSKIEFFDNGTDTSFGGYVDDVRLTCVPEDEDPTCPEGQVFDPETKQCITPEVIEYSDVTICKEEVGGDGNPAGWTLMLLGNNGNPVDSNISIPANNSVGVEGNVTLDGDGKSYVVKVDGTWLNARGEDNYVDAEYSTVNNWVSQMDGYDGYGADILELKVNDLLGDWGPFNATHVYARSFVLSDEAQKIKLGVQDSYHGDNQGSLNASVYEGYSAVTGENGCVTFQDVPVGQYFIDEIGQQDWVANPQNGPRSVTVNDTTEAFTIVNHYDFCPSLEGVQDEASDCSDEETIPQCSDDIDNGDQEDALSDENDPGCHSDGDVNNPQSYDPNDNDESNSATQCSDGISNDEDGLIDSLDPGCLSGEGGTWNPLDNDETDPTNPINEPEENTNRSGSRARGGSVLGAFTGPAVLGDSMCGEYITDYIKFGAKNDKANVMRLQTFLNEYLGLKLTVDGFYGPATFSAVKQFQIKEASEVLNPWIGVTLKNTMATGWVYKTTKRWINMIKCPDLKIPQFEKSQLIVN